MTALTNRLLHHGVSGTIEALVSVQEALRSLPARHPAGTPVTAPGARTAQEQVAIACGGIDDAVAALRTGRDAAGNSIARSQVGAGLQHLVDDCGGPAVVGLMPAALDDAGVTEFQRLVRELAGIAARLRRG